MKRILILVAINLFLCSMASAFQGGRGESTKRGSNKKKEVTKKTSGTQSGGVRPHGLTIDLGNNVKIELVPIRAGSFQMGDDTSQDSHAMPLHRVTISRPFFIGKHEVTQEQWQSVIGNNPSYFKNCGDCPVEQVSWDDTQQFLLKLNERNDGRYYRLPTEAEWEYACRAGTVGQYAGDLDSMAWYAKNSGNKTHPVGSKQANGWGLYDMHGNVFEWCQDWWDRDYYRNSPSSDPKGPSGGFAKVARGGSWIFDASLLRSANRSFITGPPSFRYYLNGFRLVATVRTR